MAKYEEKDAENGSVVFHDGNGDGGDGGDGNEKAVWQKISEDMYFSNKFRKIKADKEP